MRKKFGAVSTAVRGNGQRIGLVARSAELDSVNPVDSSLLERGQPHCQPRMYTSSVSTRPNSESCEEHKLWVRLLRRS